MIKICILGRLPDGTPNFNQRYWLAGDPADAEGSSALDGEQRQITRKSTEAPGTEFPFIVARDTGNEKLTLGFNTTRTFDSIISAWRWRNGFSSQDPANWPHPIQGDCLMRFELEDGTFEDVRLYDCLVSKPAMRPEGQSMGISYSLQGGRIEPYAVGESASPMANTDGAQPPEAGLFLTSVGGDPLQNGSGTWSSALESNNGWELVITARDAGPSPETKTLYFYFGVSGAEPNPSYTVFAPPMKNHLASIRTLCNIWSTWFAATVETVGGRSMLRVKNIRSTGHVGGSQPPDLTITIQTLAPQTPGAYGAFVFSNGTVVFTDEEIPHDDNDDVPIADSAS